MLKFTSKAAIGLMVFLGASTAHAYTIDTISVRDTRSGKIRSSYQLTCKDGRHIGYFSSINAHHAVDLCSKNGRMVHRKDGLSPEDTRYIKIISKQNVNNRVGVRNRVGTTNRLGTTNRVGVGSSHRCPTNTKMQPNGTCLAERNFTLPRSRVNQNNKGSSTAIKKILKKIK